MHEDVKAAIDGIDEALAMSARQARGLSPTVTPFIRELTPESIQADMVERHERLLGAIAKALRALDPE